MALCQHRHRCVERSPFCYLHFAGPLPAASTTSSCTCEFFWGGSSSNIIHRTVQAGKCVRVVITNKGRTLVPGAIVCTSEPQRRMMAYHFWYSLCYLCLCGEIRIITNLRLWMYGLCRIGRAAVPIHCVVSALLHHVPRPGPRASPGSKGRA